MLAGKFYNLSPSGEYIPIKFTLWDTKERSSFLIFIPKGGYKMEFFGLNIKKAYLLRKNCCILKTEENISEVLQKMQTILDTVENASIYNYDSNFGIFSIVQKNNGMALVLTGPDCSKWQKLGILYLAGIHLRIHSYCAIQLTCGYMMFCTKEKYAQLVTALS